MAETLTFTDLDDQGQIKRDDGDIEVVMPPDAPGRPATALHAAASEPSSASTLLR